MSIQVIWTKIVLEEFIRLGNLSKEEEAIMRTRADGWPISRQAMELGMSESTVNRYIKRLKKRYDAVQPYSNLLPPRKHSAKEVYMDTH